MNPHRQLEGLACYRYTNGACTLCAGPPGRRGVIGGDSGVPNGPARNQSTDRVKSPGQQRSLVAETGFEPASSRLWAWCVTITLPRYVRSGHVIPPHYICTGVPARLPARNPRAYIRPLQAITCRVPAAFRPNWAAGSEPDARVRLAPLRA